LSQIFLITQLLTTAVEIPLQVAIPVPRAIDNHGNPIDVLLAAKHALNAAKRFFRKMLRDEPLLSPGKIGTDGTRQQLRRQSTMGLYIRARFIVSPSICIKASRATICG